jgi:hypothetical protein
MPIVDYIEAINKLVKPLWERVKELAEKRGMNAEFEVYRTPARYFVRYKMAPIIDEVKLTYFLSELHWGALSSLIYMLSKIIDFPKTNTLWDMSWYAEFHLILPNFSAKLRANLSECKLYADMLVFKSHITKTFTAEEFADFLVNTLLLLKQANKEGDDNER